MSTSALSVKTTPGLRWFVLAVLLFFTLLAGVMIFARSAAAEAEASRYFPQRLIDEGLQFAFQRRVLAWAHTILHLTFLLLFVCTPLARRLADFCSRLCGGWWLPTVLLVGAICFVGEQLLGLPFRLARLELARAWGMTDRSLASWFNDYAKSLALSAGMGAVVLTGFYVLLRLWPRAWWTMATAASVVLAIFYAMALPVLIEPLFNTFSPLEDQHLLRRIDGLTYKAGASISEVTVTDASRQGRHTNAYFTGFGATKRIVLYDTLVRSSTTPDPTTTAAIVSSAAGDSWVASALALEARSRGLDEVETIFAHEMGHWVHDHIVKGIALAAVGAMVGLFLLSRILLWAVQRQPFLLTAPHDPAGLPLILLVVLLAQWLVMPVENAVSRHFEQQADAMSLELAGKPEAFIAAQMRLARDNKSDVAPTPLATFLFATHPPMVERIRMVEAWREQQASRE